MFEDTDPVLVADLARRVHEVGPGRSGQAYKTWLTERGQGFRAGIQIATLDPFHG